MEPSTPLHHLGFTGVGRMGGPMALTLQRAGFDVRVHDAAPGASWRCITRMAALSWRWARRWGPGPR